MTISDEAVEATTRTAFPHLWDENAWVPVFHGESLEKGRIRERETSMESARAIMEAAARNATLGIGEVTSAPEAIDEAPGIAGLSKVIYETLKEHPGWDVAGGRVVCAGPSCTWEKPARRSREEALVRHQSKALLHAISDAGFTRAAPRG